MAIITIAIRKNRDYFSAALPALLGLALIFGIWYGIPDLSPYARVSFITFGLAVIGWTLTPINDTYIALAAAMVFALTGITTPNEFFETLGDPMIWLLLAAFIISGVVKAVGLSEQLAVIVTNRARTVSQLFFLITGILIITSFVIPSTSGRAALMLPVFMSIAAVVKNRRIVRALSLLFPTIILLSAIGSLIGAGAHLITADILWRTEGIYIGFGQWMVLGLPFAIVSSLMATAVIMFLFLNREERHQSIRLNLSVNADEAAQTGRRFTKRQIIVLGIIVALVVLWSTETMHGINSTLVAVSGALLLAAPGLNIVPFKKLVKSINLNLLIFMAATLELGEALIESGGAQWLVENLFGLFTDSLAATPLMVVSLVTVVGLLSHLVITSRSSRASVLIPLVVLFAVSLGFPATTLAFVTVTALGFCLTLPVSAKPVAMFAELDFATYAPRDLMRLSLVLLPAHFVLLLIFAFFVWPALGLNMTQARAAEAPQAPQWYDDLPLDTYPQLPNFLGGVQPYVMDEREENQGQMEKAGEDASNSAADEAYESSGAPVAPEGPEIVSPHEGERTEEGGEADPIAGNEEPDGVENEQEGDVRDEEGATDGDSEGGQETEDGADGQEGGEHHGDQEGDESDDDISENLPPVPAAQQDDDRNDNENDQDDEDD